MSEFVLIPSLLCKQRRVVLSAKAKSIYFLYEFDPIDHLEGTFDCDGLYEYWSDIRDEELNFNGVYHQFKYSLPSHWMVMKADCFGYLSVKVLVEEKPDVYSILDTLPNYSGSSFCLGVSTYKNHPSLLHAFHNQSFNFDYTRSSIDRFVCDVVENRDTEFNVLPTYRSNSLPGDHLRFSGSLIPPDVKRISVGLNSKRFVSENNVALSQVVSPSNLYNRLWKLSL